MSLKCYHPRADARLRLFCFSWAGAGASAFFGWSRHLPDEIEVMAVQYPGREERWREPAQRRLAPLVEMLIPDLTPCCDLPFAFWGHSMGALVAFELARNLAQAGLPGPGRLFVSGRQAPELPELFPPIPDLPDVQYVAELQRRYGGVPEVIARDPEMRTLYLPTIRADLELIYAYKFEPGRPLDCGITAFGGTEDRVGREHLEGWRRQTHGCYRLHMLPGDHFFFTTRTEEVLRQVAEDMRN
jgi:medium-chain acyl-[acyl-carrier-protein] hydrolase